MFGCWVRSPAPQLEIASPARPREWTSEELERDHDQAHLPRAINDAHAATGDFFHNVIAKLASTVAPR